MVKETLACYTSPEVLAIYDALPPEDRDKADKDIGYLIKAGGGESILGFRIDYAVQCARNGKTMSESLNEMERITHSKPYADAMRMLFGVPIKGESIMSSAKEAEASTR